MKICFYSEFKRKASLRTLEREGLSGSISAMLLLARELAARGHEVHVVGLTGSEGLEDGVNFLDCDQIEQCIRRISGIAPDVLVVSGGTGEFFQNTTRRLARAIVWQLQNPWGTTLIADRLSGGILDQIVCVSQSHRWFYRREKFYNRVTFIHNGVDANLFATLPEGVAPAHRVLYVGATVPEKGFDRMLRIAREAYRLNPSVQFAVAGGISMYRTNVQLGSSAILPKEFENRDDVRENLFTEQGGMQSWLSLLGSLPMKELVHEMSRSSLVLVNPNIQGSFETCCNAALEAQAAGTCVVGAWYGALPEVVRHGETGLLVKSSSDTEFASELIRLLCDTDLCRTMGEAGAVWSIGNFAYHIQAKKWERLFDSMLAGKPFVPTGVGFNSPLKSRLVAALLRRSGAMGVLRSSRGMLQRGRRLWS